LSADRSTSLKQAGLVLGKSPRTLRRWIARGAPTAGSLGRGHGAQVDIAALQRWRSPPAAMNREQLEQFAETLRAFYRSGGHRHAGMRDEAAQLYLAALWEYVAIQHGHEAWADTRPLFGDRVCDDGRHNKSEASLERIRRPRDRAAG
jgi:hypothetical protein